MQQQPFDVGLSTNLMVIQRRDASATDRRVQGTALGDNTPRFRLLWKMSLPLGGFIRLTGITKVLHHESANVDCTGRCGLRVGIVDISPLV